MEVIAIKYKYMKVLRVYSNLMEAQFDASFLESYGIYAAVLDQNINCLYGTLNTGPLSIRLAVSDDVYSEAYKVLEERDASAASSAK